MLELCHKRWQEQTIPVVGVSMKTIVCGRCKKSVQVDDLYQFKRCENCRVKDAKDKILGKERCKNDRETKKLFKELKVDKQTLPDVFQSFSNFYYFNKKFDKTVTFPEYQEQLRFEVLKSARLENERENIKRKARMHELKDYLEPYVNPEFCLCKGKECYLYRYWVLTTYDKLKQNLRDAIKDYIKNDSPNPEHDKTCEECQTWLYNVDDILFGDYWTSPKERDSVEEAEDRAFGKVLPYEFDRRKEKLIDEDVKIESLGDRPQIWKTKEERQIESTYHANPFGEELKPEPTNEPKPLSNQQILDSLQLRDPPKQPKETQPSSFKQKRESAKNRYDSDYPNYIEQEEV